MNKNDRPQGEWIYKDVTFYCSNCGKTPKTLGYCGSVYFMKENFKYCPNCGADMRKVGVKNDVQ